MAKIIWLGSLYFNHKAQKPGTSYYEKDGSITIRNTAKGKEISWLPLDHMLVAQRCVCTSVSWNQLDENRLIKGTITKIDGRDYLCRSLITEPNAIFRSEWDRFVDEYEGSGIDIQWKIYTIGQEISKDRGIPGLMDMCFVRGYLSSRYDSLVGTSIQHHGAGFRPVLEPVLPATGDLSSFIGKDIILLGPNMEHIKGVLTGFSDYDIELDLPLGLPADCSWAVGKGPAVITRSFTPWMIDEEADLC